MLVKILIGLAIMAGGSILVIKTETIYNAVGSIAFFDKYLGAEGGSRLGYKLIGILIIFIGILVATGLHNSFLGWLLGPLIRVAAPQ